MKDTKQRKFLMILIPIVLIIICAGAVILIMVFSKKNAPEPVPYGTSKYVLDESNLSDIKTGGIGSDKVGEGMFEVTMNVDWNFKNGTSPSDNAFVGNAFSNNNSIIFEIFLEEESDPVYTSSVIPVGSQINEIRLDKDLEAGQYSAFCTYHLLDDSGEDVSTVQVNITLNIQN